MTERERIARLLYAACRKYITPDPPRQEWQPSADFLDMADAVIADRTRLTLALVAEALRQEDHACQHGTTCSGQWLADQQDRAP